MQKKQSWVGGGWGFRKVIKKQKRTKKKKKQQINLVK